MQKTNAHRHTIQRGMANGAFDVKSKGHPWAGPSSADSETTDACQPNHSGPTGCAPSRRLLGQHTPWDFARTAAPRSADALSQRCAGRHFLEPAATSSKRNLPRGQTWRPPALGVLRDLVELLFSEREKENDGRRLGGQRPVCVRARSIWLCPLGLRCGGICGRPTAGARRPCGSNSVVEC